MTFSNGDPFTAADVVYSYARVKASASSSTLYQLADITSVAAPDAHTVTVTLSKKNPGLLDYLGMYSFAIVDQKKAEAQSDPDKWLKTHTAGTGAYTIDSWDPTTQTVMTARKGYWGTAPAMKKVTLKVVPQIATQLQQLEKGSVQLVTSVPVQNMKDLQSKSDLKVTESASGTVAYLGLNNKLKPFDDKRVRQALSYAVPYDKLVSTVLLGHGTRLRSAISPITPYYDAKTDPYTQDAAKAKSLLSQAGYPNGFSFTTYVDSSQDQEQQAAVIIQSALKKIGVTMTIKTLADQQYNTEEDSGKAQSYFSTWVSFINQPGYHLGFLLQSEGSANHVGYSNPAVDSLIDEASVNADTASAQRQWSTVQTDITADAPWVYLFSPNTTAAMSKNLTGYATYVDTMVRFKDLSYTK